MAKTSKPSDESLRRTAYHEAGHAVASLFLGRHPTCVSIVPTKRSFRLKRPYWTARSVDGPRLGLGRFDKRYLSEIERSVVVFLAGREAEKRFCGRALPHGCAWDRDAVSMNLLLAAGGDAEEARLWWRLLEYRSRRLVSLRWPQIQLLAAALLVRETVSGVEVRALVAALSPKDVAEIKVSAADARRRADSAERPSVGESEQ
jgi:hypothetical protein